MQCVFCKGNIDDYQLINFDVITGLEHKPFQIRTTWSGGIYVGTAYTVALVECPHCDMVFFMKADSQKLKDMDLVFPTDSQTASSSETPGYSKMSAQEKRELYEKMKKEIIENFESDDTQ
jgi:hypothetical protein